MELGRKAEILLAGILMIVATGCESSTGYTVMKPVAAPAGSVPKAKVFDPDDGIPVHMLTAEDVKKGATSAIFDAQGAVNEVLGKQNLSVMSPRQITVVNDATNKICHKHWVKPCDQPGHNAFMAISRAENVTSELWMSDIQSFYLANTKGQPVSHAIKMEYLDSARLMEMNQEIAPIIAGNSDGWLAGKPKLDEPRAKVTPVTLTLKK